jgi:hypothetical protein
MRGWISPTILGLVAFASLAYGGVFLLIPAWFAEFSGADPVNLAWLRNVGAALVSVQGFGGLWAMVRRKATLSLVVMIALASTVESVALWLSISLDEFTATRMWTIILPTLLASVSSVFLWIVAERRRRLAKTEAIEPDTSGADAPNITPDQDG